MIDKKFITFGIDEISEIYFTNVSNQDFLNKPSGGLWSSEYLPNLPYKSDWELWCNQNDFNLEKLNKGIIFELKDYVNIFIIDSYSDLLKLAENYSYEKDFLGITTKRYIDFEKMSKDYDGLFLTEQGEWQTKHRRKIDFYGWDCSTLLLFNIDAIKNQQKYFRK